MRKLLAIGAGACTLAVGLIVAPSALAESDVCLNRSVDGNRTSCTAAVQQDDSVEAIVKTGSRTRAVYTLTCDGETERNRVGLQSRTVIPIDDEDCTLSATGVSKKRAFVRVALNEGEGDDCKPWDYKCQHDPYKG